MTQRNTFTSEQDADLIHVAGLAEPDAVTLEAAEHRIVNVLEKLLGPP